MKKKLIVIMSVLCIGMLSACGGAADTAQNTPSDDTAAVSEITEATTAETTVTTTETTTEADTEPPVIEVDEYFEISVSDIGNFDYSKQASAKDDRDGDVEVKATSDREITGAGEYLITYSAADSSGNSAETVSILSVRENYEVTYSEDNIKYVYTAPDGTVTTHELRYELQKPTNTLTSKWLLYKDNKRILSGDINALLDPNSNDDFWYAVRINDNIYYLLPNYGYDGDLDSVGTFEAPFSTKREITVCDINTGEIWNKLIGYKTVGTTTCINGNFYSSTNNMVYKFREGEKYAVEKGSDALAIIGKGTKLDSAGGLKCKVDLFNCSEKTIKYVTLTCNVYNRVDDIVEDEISGKKEFSLKMTGPYEGKTLFLGEWEPIMYNNSADRIEIIKVDIDYMDGTSATLTGDEIVDLDSDISYKIKD